MGWPDPRRWAFICFLLDHTQRLDFSETLSGYLLQSIRHGLGTSRSAFALAMGMRVEDLQELFYAWLDSR